MKKLGVKEGLMIGWLGFGFITVAKKSKIAAINALIAGVLIGTFTGTISRNKNVKNE